MARLTRITRTIASRGACTLLLALMAAVLSQQPAHAGLTWNWTFGGTESGTVTTDGTLADLASAHDFTFTGLSVTASSIPARVGDTYFENMPSQGLLWDGTKVTQFYRSSGLYTNGSNFLSSTSNYFYSFYVDGTDLQGALFLFGGPSGLPIDYTALTLVTPTAVPEPATLALSLAGLGAAAGITLRRRKAARQ